MKTPSQIAMDQMRSVVKNATPIEVAYAYLNQHIPVNKLFISVLEIIKNEEKGEN